MLDFRANSSHDIEINNYKIRIYFFNYDKSKPLGLILPGHRADTKRILPIIDLLSKNYNLISFDLPGFGESERNISYEEYISFASKITSQIIEKLQIKKKDLTVFGISLSSNIFIQNLIKNPHEFKKAFLMAPIFSYKFLSMKPTYKKFVYWFTKKLEKNGFFTKILQKIFDNKFLFKQSMIFFDIECWKDKEILDYEYDQWHLQTLQHWGASLHDFLSIDYSNLKPISNHSEIHFIYPKKDQYLDVEKSVEGFKNLFTNAKFSYFRSDKHVPRGSFDKNKEFMDSVKEILLGTEV